MLTCQGRNLTNPGEQMNGLVCRFLLTVVILIALPQAAQAAPGDRDRTFGQDGLASLAVDPGGEPVLRSLVRLPDGMLLAAGGSGPNGSAILARFEADGKVDRQFGSGGVAKVPGSLWAKLELQPGKGVIAFGRVGHDPAVARFDFNGILDPAFGVNGIRVLPVRGLFPEASETIETDGPGIDSAGRIVAATSPGTCLPAEDPFERRECRNLAIARLTADGDFDASFGDGDGIAPVAAGGNSVRTALTSDDGIVIAGTAFEDSGDVDVPGTGWRWVHALSSDGSSRTGFDQDGWLVIRDQKDHGQTNLVHTDSEGRITVAFGFSLMRLLADGTPDRSFGVEGEVDASGQIPVTSGVDPEFGAGTVTADHIVLTGSGALRPRNRGRALVSVRLTADGEPDPTYANDGAALTRIGPAIPYRLIQRRKGYSAGAMLLDDQGRVTVGGTGGQPGNLRFTLTRFLGGTGERLSCGGRPATVQGTAGDDKLIAGAVTAAGPGDDLITGAGGLVCSGAGDDVVRNSRGDAGYDLKVLAGPGNDTVELGAGAAFVSGGTGNDRITGWIRRAHGGPGNDVMAGERPGRFTPSRNTFFGGPGRDVLAGHKGSDRLYGGSGPDLIFGGPGDDRLEGGAGNDGLSGGSGTDVLIGGPGRDRLDPGPAGPDYAWYTAVGPQAEGTLGLLPTKFARGFVKVRTRCWREGRGIYRSWTRLALRAAKISNGRFSWSHEFETPWGDYGEESFKGRVTPRQVTIHFDSTSGWTGTAYSKWRCRTGKRKVTLHRQPDRRQIVRQ